MHSGGPSRLTHSVRACSFDGAGAGRARMGCTAASVLQSTSDPNAVMVTIDFMDAAAAEVWRAGRGVAARARRRVCALEWYASARVPALDAARGAPRVRLGSSGYTWIQIKHTVIHTHPRSCVRADTRLLCSNAERALWVRCSRT